MNNVTMTVKRPKIRNLIRQLVFAALTAACVLGIAALYIQQPKTDFYKILCVVLFSFFSIALAFTLTAFLNAVRNLFSGPTVILTNKKINVFYYGDILLSDITGITVNKNEKTMCVTLVSGKEITIKKMWVNIPLETLKYAISIRV